MKVNTCNSEIGDFLPNFKYSQDERLIRSNYVEVVLHCPVGDESQDL